MSEIYSSPVSKPFVITAVILVFIGSVIGSLWFMTLYGIGLNSEVLTLIPLHKLIELEGFLTLIIMGIGYTIIPRFRNVRLSNQRLAYLSYFLVLGAISLSIYDDLTSNRYEAYQNWLRLGGVLIFSGIVFQMMRTAPKLLRKTDHFIGFATITFVSVNLIDVINSNYSNSFSFVQLSLIFPIMMIYGVQFKSLPSFLGFIRPRSKTSNLTIFFAAITCSLMILAVIFPRQDVGILANLTFLATEIFFVKSMFVFGFDNSEIKKLFQGEKKIRYQYMELITRIAHIFLFLAIGMALLFYIDENRFSYYDLSIHFTAIGFIGFSIMLYLPIMLPPIINKTIQFSKFNKTPIYLIILFLAIRTIGSFLVLESPKKEMSEIGFFLGFAGWILVFALFVFVIMLHRSMTDVRTNFQK